MGALIFNAMVEKVTGVIDNLRLQTRNSVVPCFLGELPFYQNVKGDNIVLEHGGTVARRFRSHDNGIVFSQRPIAIEKKIFVKIVETTNLWSGNLGLGFTTSKPDSINPNAIITVYSDLNTQIKQLPDRFCEMGVIFYFFISKYGKVYYGIEGEQDNLLYSKVDVKDDLWVILDIHGRVTAARFINKESENIKGFRTPIITPSIEDSLHYETEFRDSISSTSVRRPRQTWGIYTKSLNLVKFEKPYVEGIQLKEEESVVAAVNNELLFLSRELKDNDFFVFEVLSVYGESMAQLRFGVTHLDAVMRQERPSDALIDERRINIIHVNNGDFIIICLNSGFLKMKKNTEKFEVLYPLDNPERAWLFIQPLTPCLRIRAYCTSDNDYVSDINIEPCEERQGQEYHGRNGPREYDEMPYLEFNYSVINGKTNVEPIKIRLPCHDSPVTLRSRDLGLEEEKKKQLDIESRKKSVYKPNICTVCKDKMIDCVLFNCGHMCVCYNCVFKINLVEGIRRCPICRSVIKEVKRIYTA